MGIAHQFPMLALHHHIDAAGNMTTLKSGNTAKYDAWDRLVEVDNAPAKRGEVPVRRHRRRIQVSATSAAARRHGRPTTTLPASRSWRATSPQARRRAGYQYVWSPRYIDAPILRDTLNAAARPSTAQRIFYLGDANYNVTALVKCGQGGMAWQVAERYTYTPYGAGDPIAMPTGHTGLLGRLQHHSLHRPRARRRHRPYYYRARFYDAGLERFISRDPIGYGTNFYCYCNDVPLTLS